jgi:hypothetical protein
LFKIFEDVLLILDDIPQEIVPNGCYWNDVKELQGIKLRMSLKAICAVK